MMNGSHGWMKKLHVFHRKSNYFKPSHANINSFPVKEVYCQRTKPRIWMLIIFDVLIKRSAEQQGIFATEDMNFTF